MKKKFTKEFMLSILWEHEDKIVQNSLAETSRWSITNELVFKHEDKHWMTYYSQGATEMQDESPWQYDGDEIECDEVHLVPGPPVWKPVD